VSFAGRQESLLIPLAHIVVRPRLLLHPHLARTIARASNPTKDGRSIIGAAAASRNAAIACPKDRSVQPKAKRLVGGYREHEAHDASEVPTRGVRPAVGGRRNNRNGLCRYLRAGTLSIRPSLFDRTTALVRHRTLALIPPLAEGSQFKLELEGVQSARVLRYVTWPGEFTVPEGVSREEESRLVTEYQSKWREESFSWSELEASITRESEQVLDISDYRL